MASDLAQNGTRAVAVYACKPADLLVVRITRPVESTVVLDPLALPRAAGGRGERERCVLLANRRNARFFVGDGGGLEETDRVEDDVHSQHDQGGWSQARYQRGSRREGRPPRARGRGRLRRVQGARLRPAAGRRPTSWSASSSRSSTYLRERIVARLHLDVENSSVEDVRAAANAAIEDWRRRVERGALDRLAEGGRGGRGAAGLAACCSAQRAAGGHAAGRRDVPLGRWPRPGDRDAVRGRPRPGDRELERCENIVEPAIEKAIEQSARVIKVRYHDDLGRSAGSARCCATDAGA